MCYISRQYITRSLGAYHTYCPVGIDDRRKEPQEGWKHHPVLNQVQVGAALVFNNGFRNLSMICQPLLLFGSGACFEGHIRQAAAARLITFLFHLYLLFSSHAGHTCEYRISCSVTSQASSAAGRSYEELGRLSCYICSDLTT